jgi:hypothetical protein
VKTSEEPLYGVIGGGVIGIVVTDVPLIHPYLAQKIQLLLRFSRKSIT